MGERVSERMELITDRGCSVRVRLRSISLSFVDWSFVAQSAHHESINDMEYESELERQSE